MAVRHAGQITLTEDRRCKTWLCKNHNTRCGLQQVGTGARPNDEEERVLNSAMQPNNGSQPAEDSPLTPLGGDLGYCLGVGPRNHLIHDSRALCAPIATGVTPGSIVEVCLAA